jgi:hypothetical protein
VLVHVEVTAGPANPLLILPVRVNKPVDILIVTPGGFFVVTDDRAGGVQTRVNKGDDTCSLAG